MILQVQAAATAPARDQVGNLRCRRADPAGLGVVLPGVARQDCVEGLGCRFLHTKYTLGYLLQRVKQPVSGSAALLHCCTAA